MRGREERFTGMTWERLEPENKQTCSTVRHMLEKGKGDRTVELRPSYKIAEAN